jgi:hypothetical protein
VLLVGVGRPRGATSTIFPSFVRFVGLERQGGTRPTVAGSASRRAGGARRAASATPPVSSVGK